MYSKMAISSFIGKNTILDFRWNDMGKIGDKYVHLLTLCLVYKRIAIPIYWHQLNKKGGHSSQEDRRKLMEGALGIFDLSEKILIADREFVGEDWFRFLTDNHFDFVVRVSKTG
jgi:hypothetical protein